MKGATGNFDTFAELEKWYIKGRINNLNKPSSLGQKYIDFKAGPKPVESSDAHASSGSAPPGFRHGSKIDVLAPSTANPDLLMGQQSPSPAASTMAGGKYYFDGQAKLQEKFFKTSRKPVESSDAHASSGSAPPGFGHGSKIDVSAPSTANPDLLMGPQSLSPAASTMAGGKDYFDGLAKLQEKFFKTSRRPVETSDSDVHALSSPAPPGPDHGSTAVGNRYFDGLAKLGDEFFNKPRKPIESSNAHALDSSSAPPGFHHGPMNKIQAPAPDPGFYLNLPPPKRPKLESSKELDDEAVQGPSIPELQ